jgi:hypothetical protein
MPSRRQLTPDILQDQKVFIENEISLKASVCQHEDAFAKLHWVQVFLYWLYLVTLGRCFEPAKYHLFQMTVAEVRRRHELNASAT